MRVLGFNIGGDPYGPCERVLRAVVFQVSVQKGWIEKAILWSYSAIVLRTLHPPIFDDKRADRGREVWERLGAAFKFVAPPDGKASIQMMHVKASAIRQKVEAAGARWEKVDQAEGVPLMVIFPPNQPTPQWDSLKKDLLTLKWPEREIVLADGSKATVLVTCEDATALNADNRSSRVFLHANSASVSFIMLPRRAGFYLGCEQDACLFDPRGTWKSKGLASEGGHYNDIEAVYNEVSKEYAAEQIWVTSACGGSAAAAYLLRRLREKNNTANMIRENGYTKLTKDWFDGVPKVGRKFAYWCQGGLRSRDLPVGHIPKETGFDANALWKDLQQSDHGKVVIVRPSGDNRLHGKVAAKHLKRVQRVCAHAHEVVFEPLKKSDPHSERYYEGHPDAIGKVLGHVFA